MTTANNIFSTNETAYAVDRSGQIVAWNQAAAQAFGYTEAQALGQRCWELLSGRDIFGNRSCCEGCPVRASAFGGESINRFQIDFKTATRERKTFTVRSLMLLNSPGKEIFVHLCQAESDAIENRVSTSPGKFPAASVQQKILTPRQIEVLALLHTGMTGVQIAADLAISVSTVRNHTQQILSKLQVHSRFEAVAVARKLGLI